jgi:hypothetical protein
MSTNVSEENNASIFKVEELAKKEISMQKVASRAKRLQFFVTAATTTS